MVGYDDQNWIQLLYDVFKEEWYIVEGVDIYYDYRNHSIAKSNYKKININQVIPSIIKAMKKEHDEYSFEDGFELEEKCYTWLIKQLNNLSKKYK